MQPLGLSQDTDTAQDEAMASLTASSVYRGPDLYEFLVESELHHYYNALTKDLKVNTVPQLKYVEEDDMRQIGMSKPEMRRLKKFFHKYCPQTYLRRIKKIIMNKKEDNGRTLLMMPEAASDKQSLRIPCKHMISADSITFNKELGSGEFGIVQQGVWTNEEGMRIQVAIKRLSKEKMQNNSMDFLKEASIMHTIDNEHIVRLYGVVLEADALMLVTELAPLRSLLECLKEPALRPSFPVISLCEFALQICDGMQYLESKRLIHRDLAARNILVYSKNKVKISDFGLSRALGVGKNYYQTNFNVNLKLPIAWCAPECINYLRFTSASDVWAYGVTLWEMFSYGFQPWAALTGQQILEAIDEPNLHRLEQPECCPKEYYALMLKCWQHDPNKRPKFQEILAALPELKPEQVLAIKDYEESSNSPKSKRDFLSYRLNEVIIVLDKRPSVDSPTLWKGVLNNGKTGLFNPANTVAYLGMDIPSMKPSFVRPDGKSGLYSSRRRIRPDMISRPQDDFKHTGHVGLDGAFFGDVSFLGDKYSQLPKQIVTPYKPHEDQDHVSLMRPSDVSDRAPLIDGGKCGPSAMPPLWPWSLRRDTCELLNDRMYDSYAQNMENLNPQISGPEPIEETENLPDPCRSCPGLQALRRDSHWTEVNNEKSNRTAGTASARRPSESPSSCGLTDHEYHEISEEEECFGDDAKSGESPVEAYFQKLDLGPSLMDEVFTALSRRQDDQDDPSRDEANNVRNEIKEITSREMSANGGHKDSSKRKHRGTVKPISPSDAKVIDSAIAIANEMATRNMLEMDSRSESDTAQDSPCTPSSPTKRKFSFRFTGKSSSPRAEKRNFTDEAASIPNIQETLTDSAKEAYNSLVEKRHFESTTSLVEEETNPLRMLRNGLNPVRPKVRGNKHGNRVNGGPSTIAAQVMHDGHPPENGTTQSQSMENVRLATGNLQTFSGAFTFRPETTATLPRASGTWNTYSQKNGSSSTFHGSNTNGIASSWSTTSYTHASENGIVSPTSPHYPLDCDTLGLGNGNAPNLLPLPPRDRTKPMQNHKPRQRKHPLIIPTGNTRSLVSLSSSMPDVNPVSPRSEVGSVSDKSPLSPTECSNPVSPTETSSACSSPRQEAFLEPRLIGSSNCVTNGPLAPVKPPRAHGLDDSFDGQIQADMDSLDDIPEEEAPVPPMYRNSDHVSCEDLLDFACDVPNAKRTQGRARGIDSDEVRIMQKVLKSEVTPEECVVALNETDWDVHKAIKYLKLQLMLNMHLISIDNGKQTLMSCSWDVQKAYNYLMATYGIVEDSTEV